MLGLWLALAACIAAAQDTVVIHQGWRFRQLPGSAQLAAHPQASSWRMAKVPGTVHTDLLANQLIPDPYVGAAEAGLQWIGLADWEYRTRFDAPATALNSARSDL
ncbi:conserved hypothetical protein, partial [Ricinus communis]